MDQPKAAVKFIFITNFLDALGIGLLVPVFPDIIRRFGNDSEFVSQYFGLFISIYAFMQFLASPVLGALSDKYGRRPVLLCSLLGAGLDYLMMAFAPTLSLLFIGRMISGLSGASMTVASSYMADISNEKNRSANFGMIGASFGLGFIVGPAVGGLLGHYSPQLPFIGAAVLTLVNFAFGFFVLPESLPPEKRRELDFKKMNPFRSIYKIFKRSPIVILIWAYLLIFLAGQAHPSTWTLYTQYKFGWTSFEVGLSLSFVGFAIAIAQGFLTRIIIPRLGERKSLEVGMCFYIIGFALFAYATRGWMMYAIMCLFALSGIAGPSLQSLISKDIPSSEQGELQGTLISISSLTAIIGPILYTSLFSHFTSPTALIPFAGVAYLTASLICLFCYFLLKVFA